jgi:hypothetical protein
MSEHPADPGGAPFRETVNRQMASTEPSPKEFVHRTEVRKLSDAS